ncbi:MAG: hypothetical protein WC099_01835 [Candidatus Paceibacterota bacterium]
MEQKITNILGDFLLLTSMRRATTLHQELPVGGIMALSKRQKSIIAVLETLGGEATTKEIAEKMNLSVNGVSQSLGALYKYVNYLGGGSGGNTKWKLK